MIYSLHGTLRAKHADFVVVQGGHVGYRVFVNARTKERLPKVGEEIEFFCYERVREDGTDLFGFLTRDEQEFAELLTSVSGVGARTALAILDLAPLHDLKSAIKEGRADLLSRASGVGRKTAERVIIEVREKVQAKKSEEAVRNMERDEELTEVLASLGYQKKEAQEALARIDPKLVTMEERLKGALKALGRK